MGMGTVHETRWYKAVEMKQLVAPCGAGVAMVQHDFYRGLHAEY